MNFELPIFNRNQGEIARTGYALTQAQEQQQSASDTVLSDVANAYEAVRSNDEVVQLYTSGYLKQAQDSRDISEYAYKRGAASLLDFLDAERSYRSVQLAYRQALASYMTASGTTEGSGGNEEPAMSDASRDRLAASGSRSALHVCDPAECSPAARDRGRMPPQLERREQLK